MTSVAFSGSDPQARITALLDPASFRESALIAGSSLCAGRGAIGGCPVAIAATNREVTGGAFGVAESQLLSGLLQQSQSAGEPVILCLDSAGARLDEGLPALGAFRQLYRHLLDLRLAGIPALALLGRDCFGGASMLAAACAQRVYSDNSRLAMSGPAVIQALGGRHELDADDAQAVAALMGGEARARLNSADHLCADSLDAYRQATLDWLAQADAGAFLDLREQHNKLGTRLLAHGMAPSPASNAALELPGILRELTPPDFQARETDGVVIGRINRVSPDTFFGFLNGTPVGALAAWALAGECLSLAGSRPGAAVTLLLDSPGQAPTFRDERILLSEYVAHLALVLSSLREQGHRVTLQVLGEAAGGIYVALAAPASRVVALPGANVQMLPPAAIARVIGRQSKRANIDDYLNAGVVDTLI
jgi:acetyl-CoA carboxylase carboxyltransferase component